jgi:hypothetical protein
VPKSVSSTSGDRAIPSAEQPIKQINNKARDNGRLKRPAPKGQTMMSYSRLLIAHDEHACQRDALSGDAQAMLVYYLSASTCPISAGRVIVGGGG